MNELYEHIFTQPVNSKKPIDLFEDFEPQSHTSDYESIFTYPVKAEKLINIF